MPDIQEKEITALIKQLESDLQFVQEFFDVVNEPPNANCSCHITGNAPCWDCTSFGELREFFVRARQMRRDLQVLLTHGAPGASEPF
jgi:hypothetical protein